ncbi:MAG: hypothetical protein WCJ13_05425 [Coriobacteriia bacterium]
MAKSNPKRREFDWRTYVKPSRLLTPAQEEAFADGVLAPLLAWARTSDSARFEVRARQAAIYHAGTMLLRIRGAEQPFVGEIDSNVRLPRDERAGAEHLETWPLSSADEVAAAVAELGILAQLNDTYRAANNPSERGMLHAFATANDGRSGTEARYIVADTEFQYGKRRFDFVGMRRAESVGGLAGFTTPRLVFGQFKSSNRALSGSSGVVAHAADFADFAQALGGTHLEAARTELDELVQQKLRLGLLAHDLPFRHFTEDEPEYLVVFCDYDLASVSLDVPLAEMHDKLVARHCRPELLRFVGIDSGDGSMATPAPTLGAEEALNYREFKRYRKQLRSADTSVNDLGTTEG